MKLLLSISCLLLVMAGARIFAASTGNAQTGKTVFAASCKTCHGAEGQGNPAIAKALKVTIPALSDKEIQGKSDEELKKVVGEGFGKMKPVPGLSSKQVGDVVAFVRSLAKP